MKRSHFLFAFALICLFIVLGDLFLWFSVTADNATFEQSKQQYLSHYPASMQNARLLTLISILLLTLAGLIFLRATKTPSLKVVAVILGLLSAVLLAWEVFSLM